MKELTNQDLIYIPYCPDPKPCVKEIKTEKEHIFIWPTSVLRIIEKWKREYLESTKS